MVNNWWKGLSTRKKVPSRYHIRQLIRKNSWSNVAKMTCLALRNYSRKQPLWNFFGIEKLTSSGFGPWGRCLTLTRLIFLFSARAFGISGPRICDPFFCIRWSNMTLGMLCLFSNAFAFPSLEKANFFSNPWIGGWLWASSSECPRKRKSSCS